MSRNRFLMLCFEFHAVDNGFSYGRKLIFILTKQKFRRMIINFPKRKLKGQAVKLGVLH